MGRAPCCDKAAVKRGPWSPEEDDALRSYVERHGSGGNWIALPKKAGLKRCGKSCRLRWLNYLRPDIRHGGFTEEEDNIICSLYNKLGSRWSLIASHLKGRTDNDVKNYWNTKLKKRVMAAQTAGAAASAELTTFIDYSAPPLPQSQTPSSLLPLVIPTVKTETYTCDDFLAPLGSVPHDPFAMTYADDGSTSGASASSTSAATTNWSTDHTGGGFFLDFCLGSDPTTDQLLSGYYSSLDPSLSNTSLISVFKD